MKSTLKDFFNEERKRVFEPGPYFTQRVMARLSERLPVVFWDFVPRATRPVMTLALVLLFAVLAAQILIPVELPTRPLETFYTQDLTAREHMLFVDPQVPASVQFEEWTLLEPTP
jgi:hypothetical protein